MINESLLADKLLEQKRAHDVLVEALSAYIKQLKEKVENLDLETYVTYTFLSKKHPSLIREFVVHAYACEPTVARDCVAAFHDDMIDLSKIECAANDFAPWKDTP